MPKIDARAFLVKPGSDVRLRHWRTDEDGGLDKPAGEALLAERLSRLDALQMRFWANRSRAMLVVLQGIDTSGKDGVIRRVFSAMNPQGLLVHSFKKPSDAEAAHDYLWRVHSRCPARGEIAVFNRSHYEDAIVGRVHGTLGNGELRRRHRQINDFERMLAEEGTVVVKLFLSISKDEQLRRLRARLEDPAKSWKFSMSDVTERARWDRYVETFEGLLSATSTEHAPWHLVPSDRKWFRNLLASEVMVEALAALDLGWPRPDIDLASVRLE